MCIFELDRCLLKTIVCRVHYFFKDFWLKCLFFAALGVLSTQAFAELTPESARAVVEQEMSAQAATEARRKRALEAMPAVARRVIQKKDHQVTINRVAPPRLKTIPDRVADDKRQSKPLTPTEIAIRMAAQPEHQSISLSVTVFGEKSSKILWRGPQRTDERSQPPQAFEIWTNVNLNYLRPIGSFKRDNVIYHYFGFTDTITSESEAWRKAYAKKHGYDYQPRWQRPPVSFTRGQLEYVVTQPTNGPVPPELYQQMDALFAHYLENEARLKAAYQRQEALAEAREAYLKENPPQPKDVIINHWPISEGGAQ